jgi:hypothetical protein
MMGEQVNDESRSKEECPDSKDKCSFGGLRASNFGFPSTFVLRHSEFNMASVIGLAPIRPGLKDRLRELLCIHGLLGWEMATGVGIAPTPPGLQPSVQTDYTIQWR